MGQRLRSGLDFPQRHLRSGIMATKIASISLFFPSGPFLVSLCSGGTLKRDFILRMHMDGNWKIIRY